MDIYNIPGDVHKLWRIYKFIDYSTSEPDDTIGPMIFVMKDFKYTKSQKVWAVYLYSLSYCLGTALICSELLDYKKIDSRQVQDFWLHNKSKLIFTSDRKYVKNLDWFVSCVNWFIAKTNRCPYKYIKKFIGNNPQETYHNMYQEVSSWPKFGRFSTILFLRTLCRVLELPMDFDNGYDWKSGATTTQGALILLNKDLTSQKFKSNSRILTQTNIYALDALMQGIQIYMQENYPNKNASMLYLTSDLCSYFKLFKGTRYLGYYVDRGLEEVYKLKKEYPEYEYLWNSIFQGRANCIEPRYLGELNNWSKPRTEKNTIFLKTGDFE